MLRALTVFHCRNTNPEIYNACPPRYTLKISSDGREIWLEQAMIFGRVASVSELHGITKFFTYLTDLGTSAYACKEPDYLTIARILAGNNCEGNYPAGEYIGKTFAKWLRALAYKDFPNSAGSNQ